MRSRGRGSRRHDGAVRLLVLSGLAGCASPANPPSAPTVSPTRSAPPTEPVPAYYTTEQATRGQRVFGTVCAVCHGRNEFTGPIFALTWMAEPIINLFQHISTAMPQDDPGSLTPGQYASVVAYMLQLNGRAAGDRELPTDQDLLATLRW